MTATRPWLAVLGLSLDVPLSQSLLTAQRSNMIDRLRSYPYSDRMRNKKIIELEAAYEAGRDYLARIERLTPDERALVEDGRRYRMLSKKSVDAIRGLLECEIDQFVNHDQGGSLEFTMAAQDEFNAAFPEETP